MAQYTIDEYPDATTLISSKHTLSILLASYLCGLPFLPLPATLVLLLKSRGENKGFAKLKEDSKLVSVRLLPHVHFGFRRGKGTVLLRDLFIQ